MKELIFKVKLEEDELRLDKAIALQTRQDFVSRSMIQQLIESGTVLVDGLVVNKSSFKVKHNEEIRLLVPSQTKLQHTVAIDDNIDLKILYQDDDLLVVDKPAGLVVHPGKSNVGNTMIEHLTRKYGAYYEDDEEGDDERPGIVHRLDKDTSGLMLVARNSQSHILLSNQIAERQVERLYFALVYSGPSDLIGTIDTMICKDRSDHTKMMVPLDTQKGKRAITHYRVLLKSKAVTALECRLETGRTHQIRVHMAYKKIPIVGDKKYGNWYTPSESRYTETLSRFPRQALHAWKIQFRHPASEEKMSFTSVLPVDLQNLLLNLNMDSILKTSSCHRV